jgi:hypothetical protein
VIQLSVVPSQNLVRGQFSLIEDVGSSPDTAEEKVREAVVAIRKVFTNKKWCKWADEWLLVPIAPQHRLSRLLRKWRVTPLKRRQPIDFLLAARC